MLEYLGEIALERVGVNYSEDCTINFIAGRLVDLEDETLRKMIVSTG